jgi:2-C-methyl-D-erythritol 4-phosphate cytidylyltransferase
MKEIPFSVIIPAAGVGKRTGQSTPKQWLELAGKPMVVQVLNKFVDLPGIKRVALALHPDEIEQRKKEIEDHNLDLDIVYCAGGKRRQDTVALALDSLNCDDKEIIVIHDAVRPFVTRQLVMDVVARADESQAAITAISVTDTIKEVDRVGYVMNTPRRSLLRRAQTPQAVRAGILRRGLSLAALRDIELTDDAIAAELIGFRVAVVTGDDDNIKITTGRDLEFARFLIDNNMIEI